MESLLRVYLYSMSPEQIVGLVVLLYLITRQLN